MNAWGCSVKCMSDWQFVAVYISPRKSRISSSFFSACSSVFACERCLASAWSQRKCHEEVLQILRSLNGQGLLQDALLQMATVSGGSSMSDAAKRRGDEISESDGFQLVRDSPKTAGSDVLTQVSEDGAVTVRGVPLAAWSDRSGYLGPHRVHIAQSWEAWHEFWWVDQRVQDLSWHASMPSLGEIECADLRQGEGFGWFHESEAATSQCYPGTSEVRKLKWILGRVAKDHITFGRMPKKKMTNLFFFWIWEFLGDVNSVWPYRFHPRSLQGLRSIVRRTLWIG